MTKLAELTDMNWKKSSASCWPSSVAFSLMPAASPPAAMYGAMLTNSSPICVAYGHCSAVHVTSFCVAESCTWLVPTSVERTWLFT